MILRVKGQNAFEELSLWDLQCCVPIGGWCTEQKPNPRHKRFLGSDIDISISWFHLCFKKYHICWAVVAAHALITALGRQRYVDFCEFEACLVFKSEFQDSRDCYTEKLKPPLFPPPKKEERKEIPC